MPWSTRVFYLELIVIQPVILKNAEKYEDTMDSTGSWSDVDYLDTDNKWDPLRALDRILVMTFAYRDPTDKLHLKGALLESIKKSIDLLVSSTSNVHKLV